MSGATRPTESCRCCSCWSCCGTYYSLWLNMRISISCRVWSWLRVMSQSARIMERFQITLILCSIFWNKTTEVIWKWFYSNKKRKFLQGIWASEHIRINFYILIFYGISHILQPPQKIWLWTCWCWYSCCSCCCCCSWQLVVWLTRGPKSKRILEWTINLVASSGCSRLASRSLNGCSNCIAASVLIFCTATQEGILVRPHTLRLILFVFFYRVFLQRLHAQELLNFWLN